MNALLKAVGITSAILCLVTVLVLVTSPGQILGLPFGLALGGLVLWFVLNVAWWYRKGAG